MLYRAPIQDLKDGRVSRRHTYTVVVMQYYPRFVPKNLVDEYLRSLAPEKELFREFKDHERAIHDHDRAFREVAYEERFQLTSEGKEDLERLAMLAKERTVVLFCQCSALHCCHADLLLLWARHRFSTHVQIPRVEYPAFRKRLDTL